MSKKTAVLIIEDYESIKQMYVDALTRAGFKVEVASDGEEALEKAAHQEFDVILLDMLMPNAGGLEFLKAFDPKKHADTKIIVLSNFESPELSRQVMDLGVVKYLTKVNYTPQQVIAQIEALLGRAMDKDRKKAE
jgi:two-component system, OmpR family, response regulator ResD